MKISHLLNATALAGSLLVANAAFAQEEPAATVPSGTTQQLEDDEAEGEIVVTGSRIRRDSFNSADPIQVITRQEATQAGFNSTTDLLQSTAITDGAGQINNAFGGFVTAGGPGANTLSLRGLGASRTLTLLNGRRIAPSGSRGQVGSADLNVLPSAMIDRIEVLNTGASSVYGSDAIAGVVNLITRTNVKGVILEGQVNVPEVGAGVSTRLSAVFGAVGDRWNFAGSVEYLKRNSIAIGDVDFTRCQQSLRRTNATAAAGSTDFIDPKTGVSKCYPTGVTGESGVTVNTLGTPNLAGNTVALAAGIPAGYGTLPTSAGLGTIAQQVCNRFRPNPAAGGALPGYECVGGGLLNLNIRDTFPQSLLNNDLISPAELYNGYAQAAYELGVLGEAEVYADVLFNRRKSSQLQSRQFTIDYPQGSPLIPAGLRFTPSFLPAQPGGITGTTAIGVRVFADYGNYSNRQTSDFVKTTVGIRGNLFGDWRYDAYAMKSWSDADYTTDLIITSKLAQSLDVVASGTGFACRNTLGGCVPAPALTTSVIGGRFPQDFFNYVVEPVTGVTKYRERIFNVTIDGPLFRLPGGDVQVALGLEQRNNSIDDTPSIRSQSGDLYSFTSSTITRGSDSVFEAFGEIELPLLADITLIDRLTINGSARYTDYRSYGSQTTYKVGAVYAPVEWLSFRGSYGTSYRAPALFEQFLGATSGFQSQNNDVCNNFGASTNANRVANCASLGLPVDFQATTGIRVNQLGGAATGLAAETSKNYTIGGVLNFTNQLGGFGRFSLAVDYFNTLVENGVSQLGFATILSQCYDSSASDFTNRVGPCALIERTTAAPFGLTITQGYLNISNAKVSGIDFVARYSTDIGSAKFRLNASVTKFDQRYNQTLPTDPIRNAVGELNNPEWTGTFDTVIDWRKFSFRYGVEWLDGTRSTATFVGTTQAILDTYILEANDYFLHTASIQYKGERFGLTLGVRNLLNADLPSISSGVFNRVGNTPLYSGYDYVGRTAFVNVTAAF